MQARNLITVIISKARFLSLKFPMMIMIIIERFTACDLCLFFLFPPPLYLSLFSPIHRVFLFFLNVSYMFGALWKWVNKFFFFFHKGHTPAWTGRNLLPVYSSLLIAGLE